jgi:protocatechuate 3,4-dioxygenase beta subunit
VIRGRVVAADSGSAIRRAMVNLMPMAPPPPPPGTATRPPAVPAGGANMTTTTMMINGVPTQVQNSVSFTNIAMARPRTATTDSQGVFEFTGLPAGTYRLRVSAGQYSAAYLPMEYGAKKPSGPGSFDPGTSIQLGDGERFDKAVVALPKGAVITGRVSDDNGDAMARVQVYTMFVAPGAARPQRMGSNAQTDDLGQFRLYGLMPGEYIVVAEAQRNTFVQPNAPPETEEEKIGFMTTYYPGTPDEGGAQRVRTRAGGETPGIEIRMATGRLFRISGMITDSQGRTSNRITGSMFRRSASGGMSSFGFSTDEQGRFQMRNIPPGEYRLVARARPMGPEVPQNEPGEVGSMTLTVASDLDGVMLATAPGATITGDVVFEQGAPQIQPGQNAPMIRVNAQMGDPENNMGMPGPQPATVTAENTFTLKGMTGEFLLRGNAPGQFLKRVMLGAEDITDTPREFKTGDKVTLVMTSRASTVEGNVTDAAGKPVTDAALIIFSDDKAAWRMNSVRTRRSSINPTTGQYRATGLLPGRYYIIATTRERLMVPSMNVDSSFFEQLTKDATTFVVGEDEQRQVDLKLVVPTGDR